MKMFMCAVFDSVVGSYMQPMFFRSPAEGIRSFSDAVGDAKSAFCAHPEDYYLALLGVFDDADGSFVADGRKLVTANECVDRSGQVEVKR